MPNTLIANYMQHSRQVQNSIVWENIGIVLQVSDFLDEREDIWRLVCAAFSGSLDFEARANYYNFAFHISQVTRIENWQTVYEANWHRAQFPGRRIYAEFELGKLFDFDGDKDDEFGGFGSF